MPGYAVGEVFTEAKYQRCTAYFYRNVFSVTPRSKVKLVAKMLNAIHAQESKKAAREKAKAVVEGRRSMKLKEAARKVEDGIEETLLTAIFPANTGRASARTIVLRGWTGRSAAAPVWRAVSWTVPPLSCWPVSGCAVWPTPSGTTRSA